jgi:methionine-rich copper-binding protein CopC
MTIARRSIWTGLAALSSLSLLFLMFIGTASAASAHAKVLSATPAIGSTIAKPPTSVSVQTAENMKPGPQFSNLFVYGPNGDLISQGNATIPLNNPREMSVPIKADGTGVYVVQWKTVSAEDGDPDQGAFVFTVGAAAATVPTATPSQQNSAPATQPGSAASLGTPILVPIVAAIVALIVGLAAGIGIGRRRTAPATLPQANGTVMREEEEKARKP